MIVITMVILQQTVQNGVRIMNWLNGLEDMHQLKYIKPLMYWD